MPIWGNKAGTWEQASAAWLNVSGTWKSVLAVWNNVAGTWRQSFGPPLNVSVSPSGAFGQYSGIGAGTATTFSVTATPTDGIGPYTYQWTYVSGDATTACTSSTSQTTTFSRTGTAPAGPYNAVWRCTVTDSAGNTGDSAHITVTTLFT